MTQEEYKWLSNQVWYPDADRDEYSTGMSCYENGWIDDFGIVTPSGQKAIEEFTRHRL